MNDVSLGRPVMRIPRTAWEWGLELLCLIGLLSVASLLYISWPELPANVPTHFGIQGTPDHYGSKSRLLLFPILAGAEYVLLSAVASAPWRLHYLWPITGQNAMRQYSIAKVMFAELKTLLVWLFAYIAYKEIQVATGHAQGLGLGFLPMTLLIVFALVGVNLRKAFQAR